MKLHLLSRAALAIPFLVQAADLQGTKDGGGGKSVVCRKSDGSIRSAEILDLYEGRTVYRLNYSESRKEWKAQGVDILKRSHVFEYSSSPADVYEFYQNAIDHLTFLPKGTSLKPIDDSFEAVVPDGCEVEQTVNYVNDRQILVDGSIWNALSQTQRAALLIHEAVYRKLRDYGETDSRRARRLTAYIVSGGSIEAPVPEGAKMLCDGTSADGLVTIFYPVVMPADESGSQKLRFYFMRLGGRLLLSRSYFEEDLIQNPSPGFVLPTNLFELLKAPGGSSEFILGSTTISRFEAGDEIRLNIHPKSSDNYDGPWIIEVKGTSIFDGSKIPLTEIKCLWFPEQLKL